MVAFRGPEPPTWPAELVAFDPASGVSVYGWHLERARVARELGMGSRVVLDEIVAGIPSLGGRGLGDGTVVIVAGPS